MVIEGRKIMYHVADASQLIADWSHLGKMTMISAVIAGTDRYPANSTFHRKGMAIELQERHFAGDLLE
jgi:hypothetical protein